MLPPLVDLEALSERLGLVLTDEHDEPTSPDGVRALAALSDASALVRAEADQEWVDEHGELDFGDLSPGAVDVIQSTTIGVAYRAFRNPEGASQASVGDVSVSYGRDGGAGALFLTQAERRALRRAVGLSSASAVEIVSPWGQPAVASYYAPVAGGGDPMPMCIPPWEAF